MNETTDARAELLDMVEAERERMVRFLQGFIRARSPNPPGDTREVMAFVADFLSGEGIEHRIVAPNAQMPNLLAGFDGGAPGRHLVLNGHLDVFPVGPDPAAEGWTADPWGGELRDGRIYGRGASDMKAGTAASIWTYALLHRLRERLAGRLALSCVSDEETFGPWGTRWLMEHEPDVLGDCCLNGEPSSLHTVRFGEKGPLWLRFTVRTPGAHGAYTHLSPSATRIAARLIRELEALEEMEFDLPHNLSRVQEEAVAATDRAMGEGAGRLVQRITLNIGRIEGGLKTNMIPGRCSFDVDLRLPVGADREAVLDEVRRIARATPEAEWEEIGGSAPSWCDPDGEMLGIVQRTVEELRGFRPTPVVSLGGTDARLWRYAGIPAYVYGPPPTGMGSFDESVAVEDFLHVLRTHLLSAHAYLTAETGGA